MHILPRWVVGATSFSTLPLHPPRAPLRPPFQLQIVNRPPPTFFFHFPQPPTQKTLSTECPMPAPPPLQPPSSPHSVSLLPDLPSAVLPSTHLPNHFEENSGLPAKLRFPHAHLFCLIKILPHFFPIQKPLVTPLSTSNANPAKKNPDFLLLNRLRISLFTPNSRHLLHPTPPNSCNQILPPSPTLPYLLTHLNCRLNLLFTTPVRLIPAPQPIPFLPPPSSPFGHSLNHFYHSVIFLTALRASSFVRARYSILAHLAQSLSQEDASHGTHCRPLSSNRPFVLGSGRPLHTTANTPPNPVLLL